MGLDDVVTVTGTVDKPTLVALMRAADALVHPSRMEGFGLPVVEALTCGTPVVCGRLPALREVAGDLPFYADLDDPSSFAQAMRAASTPAARNRLRAQVRSHSRVLNQREECRGVVPVLLEIAGNVPEESARRRRGLLRPTESRDGEVRRRSSAAGAPT